jgi:hypothetical protein
LLATLISYATYSGPFRWLADWQLARNREYDVTLTALLTAICWFAIFRTLWILRNFITRRSRRPDQNRDLTEERDAANDSAVEHNRPTIVQRVGEVATLVCWIFALYCLVRYWQAGTLQKQSAADFESGTPAASGYLQITECRMLTDQTVALIREGVVSSRQHYVPCVSEKWEPDDPVKLFVLTEHKPESENGETTPPESLIGIVRSGLPGAVAAALRRSGVQLTNDHLLIDTTQSPDDYRRTARVFFVLAIAGTVVMVLRRVSRRRRAEGLS